MAGMEIMMRRLLKEQDDRNEDWHRRQQEETKRTIESVIATHVQSLNAAIVHERTARTQAISEIQIQIQGLQAEFQTFTATTAQRPLREDRKDEVVIGGFGTKSKEGAINMVESIIGGKDGDPQVLKDKVSLIPKVVPIKFATRDHAEAFVRQHAGKNDFLHRFDGFWCNINQSAEEGANFK